jgi:hypothetical protein
MTIRSKVLRASTLHRTHSRNSLAATKFCSQRNEYEEVSTAVSVRHLSDGRMQRQGLFQVLYPEIGAAAQDALVSGTYIGRFEGP